MNRENSIMKKKQKALGSILMILLLALQLAGCGASKEPTKTSAADLKVFGETAYQYVEYLQEELGERMAGTEKERLTFDYLQKEILAMGYAKEDVETQKFTIMGGLVSRNLVVKKAGVSEKEIIIGAHYDSVGTHGVDDNGSGVAAILECAKRAVKIDSPYSFRFVFFGAEESGLEGSGYYAKNMTKDEIKNTLFMINIDSILAGDKEYLYGGSVAGNGSVTGDLPLKKIEQLAKDAQLKMQRNPGLNSDYPTPSTGDWSDHVPFKKIGVPYVYLEATNWDIPPNDGMGETKKLGEIMHTENDNLEVINKEFPGRAKKTLADFSKLLMAVIEYSDFDVN